MHAIVAIALALAVGAQSVSGEWREPASLCRRASGRPMTPSTGSVSGRLRDLTDDARTLEVYGETRPVVKSQDLRSGRLRERSIRRDSSR